MVSDVNRYLWVLHESVNQTQACILSIIGSRTLPPHLSVSLIRSLGDGYLNEWPGLDSIHCPDLVQVQCALLKTAIGQDPVFDFRKNC